MSSTARHEVIMLRYLMAEGVQTNSFDDEQALKQFQRYPDTIEAVYVGCISNLDPDDEEICNISGIQFLRDGLILLADNCNSKLELFRPDFELISEVTLKCTPVAILALKTSGIIVSLDNSCLQQVNIQTIGPGHAKMCLMPYANNKGADQPAHPRSLISAFVVRSLDSIISLVSRSEISRF